MGQLIFKGFLSAIHAFMASGCGNASRIQQVTIRCEKQYLPRHSTGETIGLDTAIIKHDLRGLNISRFTHESGVAPFFDQVGRHREHHGRFECRRMSCFDTLEFADSCLGAGTLWMCEKEGRRLVRGESELRGFWPGHRNGRCSSWPTGISLYGINRDGDGDDPTPGDCKKQSRVQTLLLRLGTRLD